MSRYTFKYGVEQDGYLQSFRISSKAEQGKVRTSVMKSIEAEAVTVGLPYLQARESVQIENVGSKFSGSWRIMKVRHEISNGGYMCMMTLNKNDHASSSGSRSAPKASAGKGSQAKSAGDVKPETKRKTVKVDLNTGKVIE